MTKRTRRETAKATELVVGQKFASHYHGGLKAIVTSVKPSRHSADWTVVSYAYPNDFSVNEMHRGQSSGATVKNDHEFTRYV